MNVKDAIQTARQILDEERISPTFRYQSSEPFANELAFLMSPLGQKGRHPRGVQESPGAYAFKSANFDLLSTLLSQSNEQDKLKLFASLCAQS